MNVLTIADVCDRLRVSRPTLLKMRRSGDFIPEMRLGPRIVIFWEADLLKYLSEVAR